MKRIIASNMSPLEATLNKIAYLSGYTLEYFGENITDGFRFVPGNAERKGYFMKFLPVVRVLFENNQPRAYVDIESKLTLPASDFESYVYSMKKASSLVDRLYEEVDWSQLKEQ